MMPENGHHITLLLNGNNPYLRGRIALDESAKKSSPKAVLQYWVVRLKKVERIVKKSFLFLARAVIHPLQAINVWREKKAKDLQARLTPFDRVQECVLQINVVEGNKQALLLDLPREDLVQAYFAADLFVFPSHVEYSPLVLFEAAAAGTPFLSSNAGNAREIIQWLGGGFMMTDSANSEGFRIIDPQVLADEISALMNQKPLLHKTGKEIQKKWRENFTWDEIVKRYEKVLEGNI